jgi:lipoyl-dependent peroxiredoxin subunit C
MAVIALAPRPLSLLPPTVGDRFPEVTLPAISGEHRGELCRTTSDRFGGKWLLFLYWSPDFERSAGILEMRRHAIEDRPSVQVLGVSMSPAPEAGTLPFPVLTDLRRDLARGLGLPWGRDLRASFLVDPDGIIQWMSIEGASRPLLTSLRILDGAPWPQASAAKRSLECMCAWCRQVQGPHGRWQSVESFIESRLPVDFTHGICPTCLDEQDAAAKLGER